jgi:hypothetical protein
MDTDLTPKRFHDTLVSRVKHAMATVGLRI